MKLLLTAFDPFGGDAVNPALEAVKLVADKIGRFEIVKLEVPTVFRKSIERVAQAIEEEKPDAVLCIGQAGGRFEITPERVAINIDDARIADNKNNTPIDEIIRKDGENAYFSTLPIKALVAELTKNNIPAAISNTAGTFVCNHIMYESLYLSKTKFNNFSAGFIHIPYIKEQVENKPDIPFMQLEMIIDALKIIIETSAEFHQKNDIKITGGYEH